MEDKSEKLALINTPDALRRPRDIQGNTMYLYLPDDVQPEPSVSDLKKLVNRMKSYGNFIFRTQNNLPRDTYERLFPRIAEQDSALSKFSKLIKQKLIKRELLHRKLYLPTGVQGLAEEYGGQCTLVAVDRDSLSVINRKTVPDYKSQSLKQLTSEVPDPTLIPPIFLKFDEGRVTTRDGQHRVAAVFDSDFPYILAYVFKDKLSELHDKIIFRQVLTPTVYHGE